MTTKRKIFEGYKSYLFVDGKDPIIDKMRTIIQDEGEKYSHVSERSGLAKSTIYNWFHGETKRPQFASVMAFCRGVGYDVSLVKIDKKASAKIVVFKPKVAA